MPFENLRRQIAQRETQEQATRLQRDEEARRKLEMEARERQGKEARERKSLILKKKALNDSIVPRLTRELRSLIGGRLYSGSTFIGIDLGTELVSSTADTSTYRQKLILARGVEDGSVEIGSNILTKEQASRVEDVEKALEEAYNHPESVYEHNELENGGNW